MMGIMSGSQQAEYPLSTDWCRTIQRDASVTTKIAEEHRALDKLFSRALEQLHASGSELQARDAFDELAEALESHLAAEESLYFPTIWALRPEFKDRLRAFIRAHHHFRGLIEEITGLMGSRETEEATHVLGQLRHEFGRHEGGEEDALHSLDEQILHDESR